MRPLDYIINLVLSVILIVGVYQFYFWCQRNYRAQPRQLYYPVIVYINFVMESPGQFLHVAMSYVVLLALQMMFFVFFPVATPAQWRVSVCRGRSERFLAFVQKFDSPANSFPSMHTSVATLTAMHLWPHLGPAVLLFPGLIALSCLFTKQHYVIDLPAGAALGWLVFQIYRAMPGFAF
jgi:membrane-associated phospholipid phosphatase